MYVYDCVCIVWSQETTPLGSQYVPILCACPALKPSLFFQHRAENWGNDNPQPAASARGPTLVVAQHTHASPGEAPGTPLMMAWCCPHMENYEKIKKLLSFTPRE